MLSRTTFRIARQQTRLLSTSRVLLGAKAAPETAVKTAKDLAEVTGAASLIGPGAKEGTIPTDYEQATGLQRLELLGKEKVSMFSTWKCQSVKVKVPCKILTWSQLTLVTDMLVVKVLQNKTTNHTG